MNMINNLDKSKIDNVINFLKKYNNDKDFYITIKKDRLFFENNQKLLVDLIGKQYFYVYEDNGIKGVLLVYGELGYRSYLKILAVDVLSYVKLLDFLKDLKIDEDIFLKVKKQNVLSKIITNYKFIFFGYRGKEILFIKKRGNL